MSPTEARRWLVVPALLFLPFCNLVYVAWRHDTIEDMKRCQSPLAGQI